MSPILLTGIAAITLALVAYTVGFAGIHRRRRISGTILAFLIAGLVLDTTATACMTMLAGGVSLTLHGVVGYLALYLMLALVLLSWRHRGRSGAEPVTKGLLDYTRIAYLLWVVAFVMGVVLGASR